MRFPFSFVKSSAVTHDPASDTLSLWLRGDSELTGDLATLAWGSRASAGASGSASFAHYGTDEVTQPGTSFDGYASVHFAGVAPQLVGAELTRTTLLGGGDSTAASYTAAYVVQPLASAWHNVDGGGLYTAANAVVLGDDQSYMGHIISGDGGVAKFGAFHYEDGVGYSGTTPQTWPGDFGTWGLLWVVYTVSSTMKLRAKTVGNAPVESTHAIVPTVGMAVYDAVAKMGAYGAGGYSLTMRIAEAMLWPGQALSAGQITTREQGYFKTRYPSLGL